jgi:hypothetical protein
VISVPKRWQFLLAGRESAVAALTRIFIEEIERQTPARTKSPHPSATTPWDFARQVPVREATLSTGWTPVDLAKDPVIAAGGVRSSKMFPAALRCSGEGESITVRFTGTTAGLIDLPVPQEVVLAVSIDGRPPITVARKETYRKEQSMGRFFFLPDQPPGPHTVRSEIKKIPDGVSYYVGPLLIVGST